MPNSALRAATADCSSSGAKSSSPSSPLRRASASARVGAASTSRRAAAAAAALAALAALAATVSRRGGRRRRRQGDDAATVAVAVVLRGSPCWALSRAWCRPVVREMRQGGTRIGSRERNEGLDKGRIRPLEEEARRRMPHRVGGVGGLMRRREKTLSLPAGDKEIFM